MAHLGLTLTEGAKKLGIGRATLQRFTVSDDNIRASRVSTIDALESWFNGQGIEFDEDGVNVRLTNKT